MKNIKLQPSPLNISAKLLVNINKAISENDVATDATNITINFRDSEYSCDAGGYQPVEIGLEKDQESDHWRLLYITDFCYCGSPYAELAKDLDFDFSADTFFASYCPPIPTKHHSVKELFELWQHNFLSYLELGVFDEIKVSAW